MTMLSPEDAKVLALVSRHPGLKYRGQALARADEAERRVIEEVRRLGQEAL